MASFLLMLSLSTLILDAFLQSLPRALVHVVDDLFGDVLDVVQQVLFEFSKGFAPQTFNLCINQGPNVLHCIQVMAIWREAWKYFHTAVMNRFYPLA